jgi:hypothetical protein
VYTQVGTDFVAALFAPLASFLACAVAILEEFKFTVEVWLPQNWGLGGGSPGAGLDSITCVYTVAAPNLRQFNTGENLCLVTPTVDYRPAAIDIKKAPRGVPEKPDNKIRETI